MSGRLEGKVAVVTGGGNGIGRACCERFAEEGADVVVADILEEPSNETIARVKEQGRDTMFLQLDASSVDDNAAMGEAVIERFGRVDVLVTAAGISHADYVSGDPASENRVIEQAAAQFGSPADALRNLPVESFQKVIDVNLTGTFLAIKALGPHMADAGSGSIVTIASVAAKRPDAGPLAYTVSKAGVWMLTKSLARSLAPTGVRVNAIGPGFIETNMTTFLHQNEMIKQMALTQIPMGRMGTPRDIANAALFLASDDASYMTGEILHPDGGFYTE